MNQKELEMLQILEKNGRLPVDTLAKMLDMSEEDTATMMQSLEDRHIILNYNTVINWDETSAAEGVTAMIDVKVTPKREVGFDDVAERIYRFPEVNAVYLMSGAYDLSVQVEGKTMREISQFVSGKLSTLESVISTTTHFILKRYKHDGVIYEKQKSDKRIVVSP